MDLNNRLIVFFKNVIQHYNHEKYWKMRKQLLDNKSKVNKIVKLYYLFRIKRMDAFHNASMGTDFNRGAKFMTPPSLPHGLNGIIIAPDAEIGRNCIIFQRVTIAQKNGKAAKIGDNCLIGTGAVIRGDVLIGNNCKIGANCVLTKDLPDNHTAVGVPAKIFPNKDN